MKTVFIGFSNLHLPEKLLITNSPELEILSKLEDFDSNDIKGINAELVKLEGLDLRHRDLRHADLSYTKLYKIDLRNAKVQSVKISGGRLQGATLNDAWLQGADLESAHLQGLYLNDAQLQGAYLQGAYLGSSMLSTVKSGFNDFRNADFSSRFKQEDYDKNATAFGKNNNLSSSEKVADDFYWLTSLTPRIGKAIIWPKQGGFQSPCLTSRLRCNAFQIN